MNVNDIYVSACRGAFDRNTTMVRLVDWLENVRPAHPRNEWEKKQLPAIMPHGLFATRRQDTFTRHSGLVQIDIDAKDNPGTNWEAARADVAKLLRQMGAEGLVSISASGCGVYALVYCPELMDTYNQHGADAYLRGHRSMSAAIVEDVHNWLGYNCDRAMINRPNGLRFVSADRDAVLLAPVNQFSISAA